MLALAPREAGEDALSQGAAGRAQGQGPRGQQRPQQEPADGPAAGPRAEDQDRGRGEEDRQEEGEGAETDQGGTVGGEMSAMGNPL